MTASTIPGSARRASYLIFISSSKARAAQSIEAIRDGWTQAITVTPEPDRAELDTAVEALVVMTRKAERAVAEGVRQVLYELSFIQDPERATVEFYAVRRVLVAWRAGKRSDSETLASLNIIDARRQMLESGADTPSPDMPEPYERTPYSLEKVPE